MPARRSRLRIAWIAAFAALAGAGPAHALLDVPTSERRALGVVDLASGAGLARPVDSAVFPFDDRAYLEAYRALRRKGLVDPLGERLEAMATARRDGRLHLEFLRPRWTLRGYVLGRDAERRVIYHTSADTLRDGFNGFLSADGAAFWGEHLAGAYEVQLQQSPGDWHYRTKRLYVKGVWGKWSLKIGRDAERLGPGYHGSLLLDDNTRALDLWRVRTEEPLFLPGRLARIGGFRITLFNAFLSDEDPEAPDPRYGNGLNPVEDPRLLGFRLSYHPTSWLDLGLSRTVLYSGKGRETYNTPKDWWKLFTAEDENVDPGESDRYDNDQYAALDVTVRLPVLNGLGPLKAGKVYWEYAGTDIISWWQGESTGGIEPFKLDDVANLGGLYLSTARTELRVEYAQTSEAWYAHAQYPQGYSYRGNPLGHHMGGDARNWFFELARYLGRRWRATAALDVEERGRSLPLEEERVELSFGLEALGLRALGVSLDGSLDFLLADVDAPLDDPDREDRTELYLGIGLRASL
ncbi:MAG: hypothetical protein Kow0092_29910 [Deferrisomatales bacterium]